jgi:hypothetical protein
VTGKRIEDERTRSRQDGIRVTEGEERSDAPTFPSFARDLDGQFNNRLQIFFLTAPQLGTDGFKHRYGRRVAITVNAPRRPLK